MDKKLRILAASDLHGDKAAVKRLSSKGLKEKVDLIILAGDINDYFAETEGMLEELYKLKQKTLFIPGNSDTSEEHERLKKHGRSIHNYYVTYGGVGIAGIGSPDWKLHLDDKDLKEIRRNFEMMKSEKKILVSHLHASGTKAEFSGVPGEDIIRDIALEFKPDIIISGHIHESEGAEDKIGKTRVIQVGKRGKILEI